MLEVSPFFGHGLFQHRTSYDAGASWQCQNEESGVKEGITVFASSPSIPVSSPWYHSLLGLQNTLLKHLLLSHWIFVQVMYCFKAYPHLFQTPFHNRHVCVISEDEKSLEVDISQKFLLLFLIALDHAFSLVIVLGRRHQAKTWEF